MLFRVLLGAEMAAVDIDAIVSLMGGVYCGQDGYLARRDSCFHHNSGLVGLFGDFESVVLVALSASFY